MPNVLDKIFDKTKKQKRKYNKLVDNVEQKAPYYKTLTDEQLKQKTNDFKTELENGVTLDELLPDAYAVVREAAFRILGMRHFRVQILGAVALHFGNISEMKTGEGKTLTSAMPIYLNALEGKGIHVVTVNDYLAERDAIEMGKLFQFLGLTVGITKSGQMNRAKKQAYEADITYGTNNEFAFDYLRDNMVTDKEDKVQKPLNVALIDEVDSVLIDEARTPLIISGEFKQNISLYQQTDFFVRTLKMEQDYNYDEKTKTATLTESGMSKADHFFHIENLFDLENTALAHHVTLALKAHTAFKKDQDYMVKDGEVLIIDSFTGRIMPGRRYSDGLHQALEAKEKVKILNENKTMATITFQNYFRMYNKLCGMTGTALTEEDEFRSIYNMDVIEVPTNNPIQRIDNTDLIYKTERGKLKAIVKEIKERQGKGQPVLVGTIAVEKSEELSDLLTKENIQHQVLNAKNHTKEAEIIANTGQKGNVTIATNMAGRGTDIKLGIGVKELGGLAVIGTERHESRRIDNQLRGRSGRQGDPGYTQFYLSLDDELMRRFGSDNLRNLMDRLGIDEEYPIESKSISKAVESAQKRVEGHNYDSRKQLLGYDDVLRIQRELIYKQREQVLYSKDLKPIIKNMIDETLDKTIEYLPENEEDAKKEHYQTFLDEITHIFLEKEDILEQDYLNQTSEEICDNLKQKIYQNYDYKEDKLTSEVLREMEKVVILTIVDRKWTSHLDNLEQLRQGIHLIAYSQKDPLEVYQVEGFNMFTIMTEEINREIVRVMLKAQIKS